MTHASPGGAAEGPAARVGEALTGLGDLERGVTRSLHGTAAPAEFAGVLRALAAVAPRLSMRADELAVAVGPGAQGDDDDGMQTALDGLRSSLLRRLIAAAASQEARTLTFSLSTLLAWIGALPVPLCIGTANSCARLSAATLQVAWNRREMCCRAIPVN